MLAVFNYLVVISYVAITMVLFERHEMKHATYSEVHIANAYDV